MSVVNSSHNIYSSFFQGFEDECDQKKVMWIYVCVGVTLIVLVMVARLLYVLYQFTNISHADISPQNKAILGLYFLITNLSLFTTLIIQ